MRSHEARPVTVPPNFRSLNFGESTLLSPSQNSGEDSLSLAPLIYATDCKSCITSCQLTGCLILGFPCERRLFKRFTAGLADPAWCWLTVFFKLGLFYCLRPLSGLKSGGHESGHRNFGFQARHFLIFKIKFSFFLATNTDDFFVINLKNIRCFQKIEKLPFTATFWANFSLFPEKRSLSNKLSVHNRYMYIC